MLTHQLLPSISAVNADAKPNFVTLEGYLVGRIMLRALEAAGPDLTREALSAALQDLGSFDMGGLAFSFGAGDNQGLDTVFLTRIRADGTFETVISDGQTAMR